MARSQHRNAPGRPLWSKVYRLGQEKVGDRLSSRHITRLDGTDRIGECSVSMWEISPKTVQAIKASALSRGEGSPLAIRSRR